MCPYACNQTLSIKPKRHASYAPTQFYLSTSIFGMPLLPKTRCICLVSQFDSPDASSSTYPQPITSVLAQRTIRRPTQIPNLIVTPPARCRAPHIIRLPASLGPTIQARLRRIRIQQVPDKHKTVVCTACQRSSPRRTPFDAVDRRRMPVELEKCLPRLPYIQDSDDL
jgi:hypothetical protein